MNEDNDDNIIKNKLNNEVNKQKKNLKRKILKKIIPIVAPLFITILVITVTIGTVSYIIQSIKNFFGLDKNSSTSITQEVKGAVYLSDNGKNYKINDAYIDNIIESLNKHGIIPSTTGLTYSEKNQLDENGNIKESMIKKYVKSEIKTMLPKIGSSGTDGIITIQRDFGDERGVLELNYVPYSEFNEYVSNNDENSVNYFSLNPDTFKLCFSNNNIVEYYDDNDNLTKRDVLVSSNEIDFQYLVEAYAMPSNFSISTHMIAQNKKFMEDILDLLEKDSKIVLTLKDTKSTTTKTVDYTGTYFENIDKSADYTSERMIYFDVINDPGKITEKGSINFTDKNNYDVDNHNVKNYYSNVKDFKVINIISSTEAVITEADTWIASKKNIYNKKINIISQEPQITNIKDPEEDGKFKEISNSSLNNPSLSIVDEDVKEKIRNNISTGYLYSIDKFQKVVNGRLEMVETINEKTEMTEYTEVNEETDLSNVEKLINLFNEDKYKNVKENFETSAELYFKLLDLDEKTQNIEQVMRYVLYKVSGIKYGVDDLESLSNLFERDMITVGEGDYIVNTAMSDGNLVIKDEEVLKTAIKKVFKGQAQKNLLDNVSAFLGIQEKYNVNAVFAISVARIESSCGTSWSAIASSTYNWMSMTGSYNGKTYRNPNSTNTRTWRVYSNYSEATYDFANVIANGTYYFKMERYSVTQIAPTYCNSGWGTKVAASMTEIYQAAGISVSNGQQSEENIGNNTYSTFTVGNKKYINYKQLDYKSVPPYYNAVGTWGNISDQGCMPSSIAIIASGYGKTSKNGSLYTPVTIVNELLPGNNGNKTNGAAYSTEGNLQTTIKKLGLSASGRVNITNKSVAKQQILNHLKSGKPIIIHATKGYYTSGGHFMTLLCADGNRVYLSNPGSRENKTGYVDIDTFLSRNVDWYVNID